MPPGRLRQQSTGQRDHRAGDDVDDDQGQRQVGVLAEGDQPGQKRIAHALHPGERIEVDTEGVTGEVKGIEGQPVIELTVIAITAPYRDGCG